MRDQVADARGLIPAPFLVKEHPLMSELAQLPGDGAVQKKELCPLFPFSALSAQRTARRAQHTATAETARGGGTGAEERGGGGQKRLPTAYILQLVVKAERGSKAFHKDDGFPFHSNDSR